MFEIGATLREARERRQLTYEQVEAETKIRAKYLRALEEEEFDSLPSGTYVRGFLRAYASYLGPRRAPLRRRVRVALRHAARRRAVPQPARAADDAAAGVLERGARRADRRGRDRRALLRRLALRAGRGGVAAELHGDEHPELPSATTIRELRTTTTTVTTARRDADHRRGRRRACASTSATPSTWVKITRISTGKVDRPEAGRRRAAISAAARSRTTTASRSRPASPGNVSLHVNGHTFQLEAARGRGSSRPTPRPRTSCPARSRSRRSPRAAVTAAQAVGGAARHRAGAPARPRRRRQHALPRTRAGRARLRPAARQHRGRRPRRDRRRAARPRRARSRDHLGRPRADARRPHGRGRGRGRGRRARRGRGGCSRRSSAITAEYARRRGADPALNRDGDRKQALVPRGATVIPPAGTAPGPAAARSAAVTLLVLPGPPRELAAVWRAALGARADRSAARARGHAPAPHAARLRQRASRRSRGRSPPPAATPAGTRTTICARAARGRGHGARRARERRRRSPRSWRACASASAMPSTPRTSGRWRSSCWPGCARAACASRWRSRARRASSARGSPTSPAPPTCCSAA